jgi:glycosyltransferase involved in cell wall biosynthesis
MKVLLNCHVPFALAHGGAQIQITQTLRCLPLVGVEAEPLRWWDDSQRGDLIHHFGRPPVALLRLAREQGLRFVVSPFLSGAGARPAWQRRLHQLLVRAARPVLPRAAVDAFGWDTYRLADACVAMTPWEAQLVSDIFGAAPACIHVVPNGVEEIFLEGPPATRGRWLVCVATIIELKQVLKLAQAAVAAQTPLWVIGKPYAADDAYARSFAQFAQANAGLVRFEGPITGRQQLAEACRAARGFVLLSKWESLSLSALEAAACGCPLLLSDLPWARTTFGDAASYCRADASVATTAAALRQFYDAAPGLKAPPKPLNWLQVAAELKAVYSTVLAGKP